MPAPPPDLIDRTRTGWLPLGRVATMRVIFVR
jgi:hypothetical protein